MEDEIIKVESNNRGETMKMMRGMLLALAPAALLSIYFFRLQALILIFTGVFAAIAAEALFQKLFKRPLKIKDGSAAVTGLLLALSVSPSLPWYALAAGSAFGIIAGKQAFGGFGKNILNPALFGRLFIIYAFPGRMAPWLAPLTLVTAATPLQAFRAGAGTVPVSDLFTGNIPGSMGEMSALLLLPGAAYLIYKRYANWRIPAGCLAAVAIVSLLARQDPLFHIFAGSLILGAFFMATDPVTSPKTQAGRWLFGAGTGLLIMAMRLYGWLPEGTTFAILAMNASVPLLNRLTDHKIKTVQQMKKNEETNTA